MKPFRHRMTGIRLFDSSIIAGVDIMIRKRTLGDTIVGLFLIAFLLTILSMVGATIWTVTHFIIKYW